MPSVPTAPQKDKVLQRSRLFCGAFAPRMPIQRIHDIDQQDLTTGIHGANAPQKKIRTASAQFSQATNAKKVRLSPPRTAARRPTGPSPAPPYWRERFGLPRGLAPCRTSLPPGSAFRLAHRCRIPSRRPAGVRLAPVHTAGPSHPAAGRRVRVLVRIHAMSGAQPRERGCLYQSAEEFCGGDVLAVSGVGSFGLGAAL